MRPTTAQLALSGNDHKGVPENGAVRIVPNPPAETVAGRVPMDGGPSALRTAER